YDAEFGRTVAQLFDNGGFGVAIGLGDQVVAGFLVDDKVCAAKGMCLEYGGSGARGRNGGIEILAEMKLRRRHTQAGKQSVKDISVRNIGGSVAREDERAVTAFEASPVSARLRAVP